MKVKHNSLKQQRLNAELELIIEEMGRTMRNAYRPFIARGERRFCCYSIPPMTLSMYSVWYKYIAFCQRNPE